ncbi:MAG: Fe-S cluster assembly protein SufB [Rickettsiales bacterium]|jgi:Fe-S cluster assembly protein SufB|nr:Fe-S cluster assembly protein SufB [Rickettsiales bacterium]
MIRKSGYSAGFDPKIATSRIARKGIDEDVVRFISSRNDEPPEVLDFRLDALAKWRKMDEPHWALFDYAPVDYNDMYFFAEPKRVSAKRSEAGKSRLTKEIRGAYDRLGVPLDEREILSGQAVDAVVDSRSVATTYRDQLAALGIIFCPISQALREHFELVWRYFASVVPPADNFFAALNSAAFSDGTFVYIPPHTKCPIELSSYFRLQSERLGQFERTLIIADKGSELTYLEGCSAPIRDSFQMHSGVVELVALEDAKINYATVQNWYGGDKRGRGGIYNFVTKRALLHDDAKVSWIQMEVGSIKTWKYPSCILKGDRSRGEFHSLAITRNFQSADTGTKMIHIGKNSSSVIYSKGVSLGHSKNGYRGMVSIAPTATAAKNFTKCDGLVIGDTAESLALPTIENARDDAMIEHEATVSGISEEKLFYLATRGIAAEKARAMLVNGFASDIVKRLPAEFALEARELINLTMET